MSDAFNETKFDNVLSYVDLNYRGIVSQSQVSYKEILLFQLTDYSKFPSFSTYPLGNPFLLFPSGSAIPLLTNSSRIRIKIIWGNETGTSRVLFCTTNFQEISYSGIEVKNSSLQKYEYDLTIPPEAKYLIIKTDSGELFLTQFLIYSLIGGTKDSPLLLTGVEAIKNCFKLWFFSSKGDYGRKIFKGGPVDTLLGTKISEVGAGLIKEYLKKTISDNFVSLSNSEIEITPLPKENAYRIKIILSDYYNKFITPIELEVS